MDWLKGMNDVLEYIEKNLTENIQHESLSRIVGCSVYEFSRIFSFMAGMSISEYIRRRRLSQAVFDIQNGNEKIIDIALKYRYESQSTFSRAFKELHNQTPLSARKNGIHLKTYPKITFKFIIKGVVEMDFRIEKKNIFKIIGLKCNGGYDDWCNFDNNIHPQLFNSGVEKNYFKAPFWYVGAYWLSRKESYNTCIIGAELKDEPIIDGMHIETIPDATWAVFPFTHIPGTDVAGETYTKVLTEWFPLSNYVRDEKAPYLEVYGGSFSGAAKNCFEVWVPVLNK
ncbi:MAG: transcriptional regulator, AraC family [Clostridia bacterium]|nr:transcriptional regulator, AraC family [Clostridia bacterium]